jgi:phage recombination protein Bet
MMEENKALIKKEPVDIKVVTDFLFSSGTKLTEQQKKLFVAIAIRSQLDPFKREIHPIPYKKEDGSYALSIVTGYEVYLKRADASGKLDGWKVWTEGKTQDGTLKACIEIKRKDWSTPLIHEVLFTEYNLGRSLWKTKPITMIKKVAIAQGFRLAFSEELAGMPYTADELPEASGTIDVTPEKPEIQVERDIGEDKPLMEEEVKEALSPVPGPEPLTEKQMKALWGISKAKGISEDGLKDMGFKILGHPVGEFKDLTRKEASRLIEALQEKK